MQVYTPVVIIGEELERVGQVGVVVGCDDPVAVKFDDEAIELFNASEVRGL
jgi:hypothetical protein